MTRPRSASERVEQLAEFLELARSARSLAHDREHVRIVAGELEDKIRQAWLEELAEEQREHAAARELYDLDPKLDAMLDRMIQNAARWPLDQLVRILRAKAEP